MSAKPFHEKAGQCQLYSSLSCFAQMAEAFRAKGALVVYVRVPLTELLFLPKDEATNLPKDIPAVADEIADAAGMQGGDLLISKRHWGAFAMTALESELRNRGVETVVLAGISTNMGVESTLRQGTGLGFAFVTVEDACSTFSPEMQDFAFKTMVSARDPLDRSQRAVQIHSQAGQRDIHPQQRPKDRPPQLVYITFTQV
jgi:nicotinamidase-related amidase